MSTEDKAPVKKGRKLLDIDEEEVVKLAKLGATNAEIADFMGCSRDVIERRFQAETTKGRTGMKIKLRQAMLRNAIENNNATIQIWLSKQWLGMKEPRQEIDFTNGMDTISFEDDEPA